MKAVCAKCRCAFEREADETWKKLCIDCWKGAKAREASSEALLRDQVSILQERLYRAESRARLLELRQAAAGAQFDAEELKTLRRLCHPDRHGGSEASTRISQRINQMLNGER